MLSKIFAPIFWLLWPQAYVSRNSRTSFGHFLSRAEGGLLWLAGVYFTVGMFLSFTVVRVSLSADSAGQFQAADALQVVYYTCFEPLYAPFRPFLPSGGLLALFTKGNVTYCLDFCPMIVFAVLCHLVTHTFTLVRLVTGERGERVTRPGQPSALATAFRAAATEVRAAARTGNWGSLLGPVPANADATTAAAGGYQLALARFVTGDGAAAAETAERVVRVMASEFSSEKPAVAAAIELLAHCRADGGDLGAGTAAAQEATGTWGGTSWKTTDSPTVAALDCWARGHMAKGRPGQAIAAFARVRALIGLFGSGEEYQAAARSHVYALQGKGLADAAEAVRREAAA